MIYSICKMSGPTEGPNPNGEKYFTPLSAPGCKNGPPLLGVSKSTNTNAFKYIMAEEVHHRKLAKSYYILDQTYPVPTSFLLLRKALHTSHFEIAFSQPFAGLDQLHHIQKLFPGHDRKRHPGDDPGPEAVHLVCTSQLHRPGATRGCKECGRMV